MSAYDGPHEHRVSLAAAESAAHLTVKPRVAVTGGRNYANSETTQRALALLSPDVTLVCGAATGADALCAELWESLGRPVERHPADWDRLGRAAGPVRNQQMIDSGVGLLIAFPGGRGTADMIRRAHKSGVPVAEFR